MKIIKYFFIFAVVYFLMPVTAFADNVAFDTCVSGTNCIENDCVKRGTCMPVCSYSNTVSGKKERLITIFYNYNNRNWSIRYTSDINESQNVLSYNTKTSTFTSLFSTDDSPNVYTAGIDDFKENTFVCPSNAYLDIKNFDEICFDNNGTSCANQFNNAGTDFSGITSALTFSYDTHLISSIAPNINCSDVAYGVYTDALGYGTLVAENVKSTFGVNTLPKFVSSNVKFEGIVDSAKQAFLSKKTACYAELDSQVRFGAMSLDEANEIKARWETIEAGLDEGIKQAISEISPNSNFFYTGVNCRILFGDQENPNDPAYWIQWILNLLKYIAIIALVVLTTIDFIKGIVQQDNDALSKALQTAVKRLVYAILIFFLPIVVEFFMDLVGAYGTCGLG